MLDFHEKRKLRAMLYSKPAAAGLLVIAVLLGLSVYERFTREREVALRRHELESKLEELKGQAAALEAEVARLRSDRGIEEELRDRFEVAKDGEQVVVIVGGEQGTTATATEKRLPEDVGFFQNARAFLTE
jgi:cell division protein FtsB